MVESMESVDITHMDGSHYSAAGGILPGCTLLHMNNKLNDGVSVHGNGEHEFFRGNWRERTEAARTTEPRSHHHAFYLPRVV
jgi:hypothetical protein